METYGRTTCAKTIITTGRHCGSAKWINLVLLLHENVHSINSDRQQNMTNLASHKKKNFSKSAFELSRPEEDPPREKKKKAKNPFKQIVKSLNLNDTVSLEVKVGKKEKKSDRSRRNSLDEGDTTSLEDRKTVRDTFANANPSDYEDEHGLEEGESESGGFEVFCFVLFCSSNRSSRELSVSH